MTRKEKGIFLQNQPPGNNKSSSQHSIFTVKKLEQKTTKEMKAFGYEIKTSPKIEYTKRANIYNMFRLRFCAIHVYSIQFTTTYLTSDNAKHHIIKWFFTKHGHCHNFISPKTTKTLSVNIFITPYISQALKTQGSKMKLNRYK